jgi:hypothetical protein
MVAACYILGQKHYPIPYELKTTLLYLIGGGVIVFLNSKINFGSLGIAILYHNTILSLFLAIILWYEFKVKTKKLQSF